MTDKPIEQYHAEMLWKHLDDLAENNPEEYQKFISHNIKNGLSDFGISKHSNNSNKETPNDSKNKIYNEDQSNLNKMFSSLTPKQKFIVKPFMCLRFKILKLLPENSKSKKIAEEILVREKNLGSNELSEVDKIKFSFSFLDEANSDKVLQEPKIYLNIIDSEDFFPPVNNQNLPENNTEKWNYIPSSFRPNGEKKSMRDIKCLFYDCIISSKVSKEISSNEKLKNQVLSYICKKFNIFLSDYCTLYMKNIKIVSNHKYKSVTSMPKIWEQEIVNKDSSLKVEPSNKFENKIEKNKILTKKVDEEKNILNILNTNSVRTNNTNNTNTKVMITEVNNTKPKIQVKNKKKLDNNRLKINFEFLYFKTLNSNEILLEISENEIKLQYENMKIDAYTPVYLSLGNEIKINTENCVAYFNKEVNELIVIVEKIN